MFLVGLLLAAASAALAVEVVVSNTGTHTIEAFNRTTEQSLGTLYVGGVVTALVFALGLAMFVSGLRHTWQERRAARRVAKQTRDSVTALQAENRRLRTELEAERARSPIQPVTPGDSGADVGGGSAEATGYARSEQSSG